MRSSLGWDCASSVAHRAIDSQIYLQSVYHAAVISDPLPLQLSQPGEACFLLPPPTTHHLSVLIGRNICSAAAPQGPRLIWRFPRGGERCLGDLPSSLGCSTPLLPWAENRRYGPSCEGVPGGKTQSKLCNRITVAALGKGAELRVMVRVQMELLEAPRRPVPHPAAEALGSLPMSPGPQSCLL